MREVERVRGYGNVEEGGGGGGAHSRVPGEVKN
jgi:hypothetical protein